MNEQESHEKNEQDRRYRGSQDDISIMRKQLERLAGNVGDMSNQYRELIVAIRGNDLGTDGIVGQIKQMREKIDEFEERLNLAETKAVQEKAEADKQRFKVTAVWILLGSLATLIGKWILDHLFSSKS